MPRAPLPKSNPGICLSIRLSVYPSCGPTQGLACWRMLGLKLRRGASCPVLPTGPSGGSGTAPVPALGTNALPTQAAMIMFMGLAMARLGQLGAAVPLQGLMWQQVMR